MNDSVIHSARVMGIIENALQTELDEAEAIYSLDPSSFEEGYVSGVQTALNITKKEIEYTEGLLDSKGLKELARLRSKD